MGDCRFTSAAAHQRPRWKTSRSQHHRDQGSSTVEMVLLAPVLMTLILFIVFAGRLTQAQTQLRHAADQAARAASLAGVGRQSSAASDAALQDLFDNGVACLSPSVSTTSASDGGVETVTATVSCALNRSELAPLAPGAQTIVARSTEVIDRRRGGGQP